MQDPAHTSATTAPFYDVGGSPGWLLGVLSRRPPVRDAFGPLTTRHGALNDATGYAQRAVKRPQLAAVRWRCHEVEGNGKRRLDQDVHEPLCDIDPPVGPFGTAVGAIAGRPQPTAARSAPLEPLWNLYEVHLASSNKPRENLTL